MFSHNNIAIRVIEKEDLDFLRELHNDQSTWENLLNIHFIDEIDQLNWWENLHIKKNEIRLVICFSDNIKEIIGRLRILRINHYQNNCEVGLDIIPKYRGKGYGYSAYKLILDFLFNHFNMHMVYLMVADFNPTARNLYRKLGFKETGRLPEYFFRHGRYWDYVIYSMTKELHKTKHSNKSL